MRTALLTVVTVVRNGAAHLEETIQSVICCCPRPIDYVVIDGGSTDGTLEIIRRYAASIRYWSSEPDGGIYHAMNKGWAAAGEGSFVLYLGAGDRLLSLPSGLERYAANEVVCGSVQLGEGTVFTPRTGLHLRLYNSLHHQALLINKALHPEPPFDTRFPVYADFDFNQRLMKGGARFVFDPSFKSYALPGGVSDQSGIAESLRVIGKNFGWSWSLLAGAGFVAMRTLPFLQRFRPFRETGRGA